MSKLRVVEELTLSKNPMKTIPDNAFQSFGRYMEKLHLDNMGLEKFSEGAFTGVTALNWPLCAGGWTPVAPGLTQSAPPRPSREGNRSGTVQPSATARQSNQGEPKSWHAIKQEKLGMMVQRTG
ncbi:hypothetical protein AGOR_G00197450 [Albula goreensis]|uniref:Uncharacterized protein n=1 Tax=Albula goreensis TaxID=1534307 RepID=A0A8T3CS94_9TELE|nr:hypothetical protein AGOR_G00197450 [Albula goreensis]